jgi:hypothetical protein
MNIAMRMRIRNAGLVAVLFAVLILVSPPVRAAHQRVVGGLIINIGVATAEQAAHFPEELNSHPELNSSEGNYHLVVSLSDAQSGAHVADAAVSADVRGPDGQVQSKGLVSRQTSGVPDYSSVFDMHRPGRYRITVHVKTTTHAKPLTATFEWMNSD